MILVVKTMPLAELLGWLSVDPEHGEIVWNKGKYAGRAAGGRNSQGYWVVNIRNTHYRAHHIVWRVANGYWPTEIDHVDGDRLNNKLSNLREVSRAENRRNVGVPANHPTGVLGVLYDKRTQKWTAKIGARANHKHLGSFSRFEDAVAARREEERRQGYHPNHGLREATCGL